MESSRIEWTSPTNGSRDSTCFRYDSRFTPRFTPDCYTIDLLLVIIPLEFPTWNSQGVNYYINYINRRPYMGRAPHYSLSF